MFEILPADYQMRRAARRRQRSLATNETNRSQLPSGLKPSVMILIRCTKICRTKKLLAGCPAVPSLQNKKTFPRFMQALSLLQGINSTMNPASLAAVLEGVPQKLGKLGSKSSMRICMFSGRIAYLEDNQLGRCPEDKMR